MTNYKINPSNHCARHRRCVHICFFVFFSWCWMLMLYFQCNCYCISGDSEIVLYYMNWKSNIRNRIVQWLSNRLFQKKKYVGMKKKNKFKLRITSSDPNSMFNLQWPLAIGRFKHIPSPKFRLKIVIFLEQSTLYKRNMCCSLPFKFRFLPCAHIVYSGQCVWYPFSVCIRFFNSFLSSSP